MEGQAGSIPEISLFPIGISVSGWKVAPYEHSIEPSYRDESGINSSAIDLSLIPVNKGIKSRLGWTKYSDLYEIVHPSLGLISLCLLTGA